MPESGSPAVGTSSRVWRAWTILGRLLIAQSFAMAQPPVRAEPQPPAKTSPLTSELTASWSVDDGYSLRVLASVSSAAKLPSFFALGHPLVGNPRLTREGTRQVEAYYARDGAEGSRF